MPPIGKVINVTLYGGMVADSYIPITLQNICTNSGCATVSLLSGSCDDTTVGEATAVGTMPLMTIKKGGNSRCSPLFALYITQMALA
jgi:hypothetical protein